MDEDRAQPGGPAILTGFDILVLDRQSSHGIITE